MTTPTFALPAPSQHRTPSVALPLVFITIGAALLLANLGYLNGFRWSELLRLWPVLIILAGTDLLVRPRSFLAAAVIEIAIVAIAFMYVIIGTTAVAPAGAYVVDVPRAAVTNLGLTVNYGAGTLNLTGGATALVSVRSTQQDVTRTVDQSLSSATVVLSSGRDGVFWTGTDRRWDVTIPSDVRTGLTLNLGAGSFDVDLTQTHITRATINAGASSMTIALPRPQGDVPVKISTGASSIEIRVPQGVAYRINYTGVLQSISGPASSAGYDTATDRLTIDLSSAMSSVSIH